MHKLVYLGEDAKWRAMKIARLEHERPGFTVEDIGHGYIQLVPTTAHGAAHIDSWGRIESESSPSPFSTGKTYCRCGAAVYGNSHEEVAAAMSLHVDRPDGIIVKARAIPVPDTNTFPRQYLGAMTHRGRHDSDSE